VAKFMNVGCHRTKPGDKSEVEDRSHRGNGGLNTGKSDAKSVPVGAV
jgi:hypothetical protein